MGGRHADHLRRLVMLEPRGHADMCGAVLTEPVAPGSHAGVLFMNNEGYGTMSGHGIIAADHHRARTRTADARRRRHVVVFDTPAGTVRARAGRHAGSASSTCR